MINKKYCNDCIHFYKETTCGYSSCNCYIYGSLDMDQHERHPGVTANTCKDYSETIDPMFYTLPTSEK